MIGAYQLYIYIYIISLGLLFLLLDDSFLFKQIQIYEDKKIAFDIMKTQFESSANKHIDDPSTSTSCNTDFLSQAIYEECINEEPTTGKLI